MKITHKVRMDLVRPSIPNINMVQGDRFTRQIEIIPLSEGKPWDIPQDVTAIIRYEKPNKQFGVYDTLAAGEPAAYVKGSHLFVTVAPDVLTVAGSAQLSISLIRGDRELSTFAIQLLVHPNHRDSSASDVSGVSVTGMLPAPEHAAAGQFLIVEKTDENGKILRVSAGDAPEDSTDYTPFVVDVANDMTTSATVDQVTEAHENGRNVWCVYRGVSYPLSRIDTERIYFCAMTDRQTEVITMDLTGTATYTCTTLEQPEMDYTLTDADKEEIAELVETNALLKSGGTMTGAIAMGGNKISGLAAPTEDSDAATKAYVASAVAAAAAGARVQTGSYTGTGGQYGTHTSAVMPSLELTFDFTPKFVMIYPQSGGVTFKGSAADSIYFSDCLIWGSGNTSVRVYCDSAILLSITQSGNTLSITCASLTRALNKNNTYNYVAIS